MARIGPPPLGEGVAARRTAPPIPGPMRGHVLRSLEKRLPRFSSIHSGSPQDRVGLSPSILPEPLNFFLPPAFFSLSPTLFLNRVMARISTVIVDRRDILCAPALRRRAALTRMAACLAGTGNLSASRR